MKENGPSIAGLVICANSPPLTPKAYSRFATVVKKCQTIDVLHDDRMYVKPPLLPILDTGYPRARTSYPGPKNINNAKPMKDNLISLF